MRTFLRQHRLQPLLDDISPLALSSNEDRSVNFASQRNSATILKVSVTGTGACLQGNVEPFITLPGKACCTGLAYSEETKDLYVADSQDKGGIYLIDAAGHDNKPSYVKVFVNGLEKRAYDLAIASSGEVSLTDVEARKIGIIINSHDVVYVVGSGKEETSDGYQETISFVQPTGLCSEGRSLYVADTGAGALKLITKPRPMARLLESVSALYTSHGIHSPATSIEDCVASLNKTTAYFETAIKEAKESSGGRKTVEGPHRVRSSKTVQRVRMTVEALKNIKKNVLSVNSAYVSHIQPKSLVSLIVEHFNSKMREIYEVPTVLQYTYQFPDAVQETVKRVTNCGFSYFTSRGSYYEVPEGMVAFDEMPKIPRPPKTPGSQGDIELLRKWANDYGKATRQLSVRAKSTKDNPGTLPISAYRRCSLANNPLMSREDMRDNISSEEDRTDVVGEGEEGEEEEDCSFNENFDGSLSIDTSQAVSPLVFTKDSMVLISKMTKLQAIFYWEN